MDAGLTIRPIANVAAAESVRTAPGAVTGAVRTELAPSQSVTAPANTGSIRNDLPLNQPDTARELIVDPAAREVIYRVVDVSSGRVVRQVPDEAMLRLRAYTRALESGKSPNDAFAHTDHQA